jgi:hypothetical protein
MRTQRSWLLAERICKQLLGFSDGHQWFSCILSLAVRERLPEGPLFAEPCLGPTLVDWETPRFLRNFLLYYPILRWA